MKSEEEYVEIICNHFKENGFLAIKHLRIPPREIDIVAMDPTNLFTISVEVKLRDWKKVINQSIRNRKYSHFNYIALPSNISQKLPEETINKFGLGIMIWDFEKPCPDLIIKSYPSKSLEINHVFKRRIYEIFRNEYSFAI